MRILVFHGYLLRGTGSNIYNLNLCRALASLGHEVLLLCQERHADELDLPEAVTIVNPDIGRTLPVYVADEYEYFDAVPFPELGDEELESYVDANVAAVRDAVASFRPEVALANHLVMGPAVLARGLGGDVPYAVKIHGSALEYTVRPHRERFLPYALEGLRGARGVLVGSRHSAESLWEVCGEVGLPARTRLGPPGVDVHEFRPRPRAEAAADLARLAGRLGEGEVAEWGGERDAAGVLRSLDPQRELIVSYVGKLIVSKGVDLLVAAWPLVVAEVPAARLCIVGFGTFRDGLLSMVEALRAGDLASLRDIAARGRELEGGPRGELSHLACFLEGLGAAGRERYLALAPRAAERIAFTGRLEHDDLPLLLAACEAQVVPSTFPESFGMVAAEAAACGVLPLSASHSGLAEVTATLTEALAPDLRQLLAFAVGPAAVEEISAKLVRWLTLPAGERAQAQGALAELARRRYGWEVVARGVIAAAQGRLDELSEPFALARGRAAGGPSGAP